MEYKNESSTSTEQLSCDVKNGETISEFGMPIFKFYEGMDLPPFPRIIENVGKQFEDIKNLQLKNSDVILCTFPKSGTNWTHEVITMLLNGSAEYAKHNKRNSMLEAINVNEELPTDGDFRILNTHVPYRHLPEEHITKGIKIIHVIRNPKDVFVSSYNFIDKLKMFGVGPRFHCTWDKFITFITEGQLKPYGGWCKYILDFEREQINNPNIFTLFFEDMKKDPETEIERMAKFLGVAPPTDLIKSIAEKTTFTQMAAAVTQSYRDKHIFESESKDGTNFFLRKGEVGDWKNWFTVAQNERFDAMLDREMKDSKIHFQYKI